MFEVFYDDNTGCAEPIAIQFESERDAENFIEEQLENVKQSYLEYGIEYDYGDFYNEYGNVVTEIWAVGNDGWASWTRLWT